MLHIDLSDLSPLQKSFALIIRGELELAESDGDVPAKLGELVEALLILTANLTVFGVSGNEKGVDDVLAANQEFLRDCTHIFKKDVREQIAAQKIEKAVIER